MLGFQVPQRAGTGASEAGSRVPVAALFRTPLVLTRSTTPRGDLQVLSPCRGFRFLLALPWGAEVPPRAHVPTGRSRSRAGTAERREPPSSAPGPSDSAGSEQKAPRPRAVFASRVSSAGAVIASRNRDRFSVLCPLSLLGAAPAASSPGAAHVLRFHETASLTGRAWWPRRPPRSSPLALPHAANPPAQPAPRLPGGYPRCLHPDSFRPRFSLPQPLIVRAVW